MSSTIRTLTVRVPNRLYRAATRAARKRRISVSELIVESLQAGSQQAPPDALYESFTELGKVAEDCDVEYAIDAQREVIRQNR